MLRKISVVVLFILFCSNAAMSGSKNHKTEQAAAMHHHDATQHNCAACHSLSKARAGELLKQFGEVKECLS